MSVFKIAVIPGDGIGPEVTAEAVKVINMAAERGGHRLEMTEVYLGGCSIDRFGEPLTDEAVEVCRASDAVLMGSIGGDAATSPWYKLPPNLRPEAGLLRIRKELGLFANLRPAYLYPELAAACPLKESVASEGFDIMMVRELTGGLYFGERYTVEENGVKTAVDTLRYSDFEIRRVAEKAFDAAAKRRGHLTLVDKANVLDSSRLWREIVSGMAKDHPDITFDTMLVDNCAMQLIKDPGFFDVVLTENMFGDILSDEASMIAGSIGMLPSASLGEGRLGLYEPSGGSAPDIAGKGIANPLATILSGSMLLRYSLGLDAEADMVDEAVRKTLADGIRTADIAMSGEEAVSTSAMGDAVCDRL